MRYKKCPSCLNELGIRLGECGVCGFKIKQEFEKLKLVTIGLGGSGQKEFYGTQLIQSLVHGALLETGNDARVLSSRSPLICLYHKGLFGQMRPKALIRLTVLSGERDPIVWKDYDGYIYFLEDKKDEKSLEDLIFGYREEVPRWKKFLSPSPCLINLPRESRLLSKDATDSDIMGSDGDIISFWMRRTFGVRWGRRLLILVEKAFPRVRFNCFDVASQSSFDEMRLWDSFVWILAEKGLLHSREKKSFVTFLKRKEWGTVIHKVKAFLTWQWSDRGQEYRRKE